MPLIYAGKRLKVRKMSQLKSLLEAVKDHKLSKEQLEGYHAELTHLYSAVLLERADLRKKEAFFYMDAMKNDPDESDTSIKRKWRVEPDGQRLLELEAYKTVLPKEIDSCKTRIYALL